MTIQRMDHVGIVVYDLAAAEAFSLEPGVVRAGASPAAWRFAGTQPGPTLLLAFSA